MLVFFWLVLKEVDMKDKNDWRKNPVYLADIGGLFGAPPNLKCVECGTVDYELFYGHCKKCAQEKNIPQNVSEPEEFHEAVKQGSPIVVKTTKEIYPWWHFRRWF
jgi:hypothetical protein